MYNRIDRNECFLNTTTIKWRRMRQRNAPNSSLHMLSPEKFSASQWSVIRSLVTCALQELHYAEHCSNPRTSSTSSEGLTHSSPKMS